MQYGRLRASAAVAAVATIVPVALVVGTAIPASASTWSGSVSLVSSASSYVYGGPQPTLVASVSSAVSAPYQVTIYNGVNQRVADCSTGSIVTCTALASAAVDGSVSYTAYVAQDAPTTGPPTVDVQAVSVAVTVTNHGYEAKGLSLAATSTTYTSTQAPPMLIATVDPGLQSPYRVSIYDDANHLVNYCTSGNWCSAGASAPTNATRTYTAYLAEDSPTTGPPVNHVQIASTPVTITNTGYSPMSLTLTAARTTYSATGEAPMLEALVTPGLTAPYQLSIYDDRNVKVTSCSSGQTCTAASSVPLNGSRIYTAYIAQDAPATGPPSTDVRASSNAVTITNGGLPSSDTLTLDASASSYNADTGPAMVIATVHGPLSSGYRISIYDQTNHLLASSCTGSVCTTAATAQAGQTGSFTAYVAQDAPTTGPPTNDVKLTSGAVTVTNLGGTTTTPAPPWAGTVTLATSSTSYSIDNAPTPTVVAYASARVTGSTSISVYDAAGNRVASCQWTSVCTASVTAPLNSTRGFTAYVGQDAPTTGPPASILATSNVATVANSGYVSGGIALFASPDHYAMSSGAPLLFALPAFTVTAPYIISIYTAAGQRAASCAASGSGGYWACQSTASVPLNSSATYTAYIAQDAPTMGPPVNDVRATSASVAVTNTGYAGAQIGLYATTTSYGATDSAPTLIAAPDVSITTPYIISIYNGSNQRVGSCAASGSGGYWACTATGSAPLNGSATYTAYVAQDAPTGALPSSDLRLMSAPVTVTNSGYSGLLQLTTGNAVKDDGSATQITAIASPTPPSPYVVSIYRTDTWTRLGTCTATTTCTVAAPALPTGQDWLTIAAFVAEDAPLGTAPSAAVAASTAATIQDSALGTDIYADLLSTVYDSAELDQLCVDVAALPQPRTEQTGSLGVLGAACESEIAKGTVDIARIVKAILIAAGAIGGAAVAYHVLDELLTQKHAVDPTKPPTVDPPPPGSPPSGLPAAPNGPAEDRALQRIRGPRLSNTARPWTDTEVRTVIEQCRSLLAQYGGGLTFAAADPCTLAIFVPGYDVAQPPDTPGAPQGPADHDLSAIASNPNWLQLHYVSQANKGANGLKRDWYKNPKYQTQPTVCTDTTGGVTGLECDEYPFYTSAEGGPGASLLPVDADQNGKEGTILNGMYQRADCHFQSGIGPDDTSGTPYLVLPMPSATLGIPTGYLCA